MQGTTPTYCADCGQETLKAHSNYDYHSKNFFTYVLLAYSLLQVSKLHSLCLQFCNCNAHKLFACTRG
ncbi:hypothetical protein HMPREF9069_01812 [Atopobium sp. oral taxon 810 str. F0209]|nr:hypothetical protein HMPREF9069_01812 [Atopobium sp. oral taxon 810 str. F0209]